MSYFNHKYVSVFAKIILNISIILPIILTINLGFISSSFAAENNNKTNRNTVFTAIQKHFPNLKPEDVSPSVIKGLYEVAAGPNILYVTPNGQYLFSGEIIDINNNFYNLTEEKRRGARLKTINTFGSESMITYAANTNKNKNKNIKKHTITVFTDIDCGYCRKFHADMKKMNDLGIEVRYLAFPRAGLNSDSYDTAAHVWCAENKQQAMTDAKLGLEVKSDTNICDTHNIDKQFQLGVMMGVTGTPTIVFSDGTMVPGYLPPEKLLEAVEAIANQG